MQLLLGAGSEHSKRIWGEAGKDWDHLVTCDINPDHRPDVLADLNQTPWPFASASAEEIHAYEVLEHLGTQGDWRYFFDSFGEVWRILEPGGHFCATCPSYRSMWAWGDPSHTRVLTIGSLAFLDQDMYAQVGKTAMSDFRFYWKRSLKTVWWEDDGESFRFVLRKEG